MTKQEEFADTLEKELGRVCGSYSPVDTLKWLLERQKTYVGRWEGFVSLKKISPKALVENDFFLSIIVCSNRINAQLELVFVSSRARLHWQEFSNIIADIKGDFSISKAHLLDTALTKFIFELPE
jgi:hypothetical protein